MKKLMPIALFFFTAGVAMAQPYSNWVSPDGQVVKNDYDECWRSDFWAPETAHPDCGGAQAASAATTVSAVDSQADALPLIKVQGESKLDALLAEPITTLSFSTEALFDVNKAVIKVQGKSKLDALLAKLSSLNWTAMTVEGHTDSTGPAAYNQGLSERRAASVKSYLVGKGLSADAIQASGMGETAPVADNGTSAGRAQNRRVEVGVEVDSTAK